MPQRTVMQGANGSYVYVVKADNTVERRTVEVAATQDGIAVIGKGLAVGEKVVVDGQYRLTNGAQRARRHAEARRRRRRRNTDAEQGLSRR